MIKLLFVAICSILFSGCFGVDKTNKLEVAEAYCEAMKTIDDDTMIDLSTTYNKKIVKLDSAKLKIAKKKSSKSWKRFSSKSSLIDCGDLEVQNNLAIYKLNDKQIFTIRLNKDQKNWLVESSRIYY